MGSVGLHRADARWEVEKSEAHAARGCAAVGAPHGDDDFGVIRLGMGTLPSTVLYVSRTLRNPDSPLARVALEAGRRFPLRCRHPGGDLPAAAAQAGSDQDKPQENGTGCGRDRAPHAGRARDRRGGRGHVGVRVRRARLLAHFAVFHAPMDAHLYVLAPQREKWAWTEHCPTARGDETNRHTCFLDWLEADRQEEAAAGEDRTPLARYLEGLRRVLAQRKLQLQETRERRVGSSQAARRHGRCCWSSSTC